MRGRWARHASASAWARRAKAGDVADDAEREGGKGPQGALGARETEQPGAEQQGEEGEELLGP